MLEIFVRQELLDREMAPVVGRCWFCGVEIYNITDLDLYDGLCEECFVAQNIEEDDGLC